MENAKKSDTYEPTLLDVLEAVQSGFKNVEERFEKVDERFDKIDERFDRVENRMTAVERRVGTVETTLEEMSVTLKSIEQAVDKDAEAIVNHEGRVSHLEKLSGIVSVPVAHLAGLES